MATNTPNVRIVSGPIETVGRVRYGIAASM
jgi:hypothetical protein